VGKLPPNVAGDENVAVNNYTALTRWAPPPETYESFLDIAGDALGDILIDEGAGAPGDTKGERHEKEGIGVQVSTSLEGLNAEARRLGEIERKSKNRGPKGEETRMGLVKSGGSDLGKTKRSGSSVWRDNSLRASQIERGARRVGMESWGMRAGRRMRSIVRWAIRGMRREG